MTTPHGSTGAAEITAVIGKLSREFAVHSGEQRSLVAALVEIVVWRAVHGYTAAQITGFLNAHVAPGVRPDFVAWVVAEAGRRLGDTPVGGA